jgi:hypothetical protein
MAIIGPDGQPINKNSIKVPISMPNQLQMLQMLGGMAQTLEQFEKKLLEVDAFIWACLDKGLVTIEEMQAAHDKRAAAAKVVLAEQEDDAPDLGQ